MRDTAFRKDEEPELDVFIQLAKLWQAINKAFLNREPSLASCFRFLANFVLKNQKRVFRHFPFCYKIEAMAEDQIQFERNLIENQIKHFGIMLGKPDHVGYMSREIIDSFDGKSYEEVYALVMTSLKIGYKT